MKKKIIIISALISFSFACAQVGVNTSSPKATFDITAKNPTGILSTAEGLLIPRVDRQKAQSMAGVVTSTLIYVNNAGSGTQTGTAINIDAVGYYYFDGTVWTKINQGSSGMNTNIYTVNGNLTSNRTVSQTGRTLAFTGTAANAFSVDGATLSINTTTHAIGIGTTTPTNKMVVKGVNAQPSSTSATLRIDGSANHALDMGTFNDSPYGSYITSLDKSGTGLPLILNPFGSSVGIGIINPSPSAVLDLFATDKGFLPPRLSIAQRDALNPKTAGLMVYNTTTHCMEHWDTSQWVSKCSTSSLVLDCAGVTHNGTLTSGVSASGVSTTIPYTGGNGSAYAAQAVASTGITGLTATLDAGNFANGNGTLTYTITGTPSDTGTATFNINIGGQTCTFTRNVAQGIPAIDNTPTCTGTTLNPQFSGSQNFVINGKNVTATYSNASNAHVASYSYKECNNANNIVNRSFLFLMSNKTIVGGTDPYGLPIVSYPTSCKLTIKFSSAITNLKVFHPAIHNDEKYKYTFKRNGVTVNPKMQLICNEGNDYSITSNTVTSSRYAISNTNGTYIIGGDWFDEVEINGTQTGGLSYPRPGGVWNTHDYPSGSPILFCVGAAL